MSSLPRSGKPLQVVVASTNRAKVEAARRVFTRFWPDAAVTGIDVDLPAEIPPMPIGWQVKAGALYRARAASATGADFGVGAEGGVEFVGDTAYLYNWVAVCRRDGVVRAAPSAKLELPPAVAEALRRGAELGELMKAKTGRADINHTDGAVGYYTGGLISRQAFFEGCMACALAPFLFPEEYGLPPLAAGSGSE